MSTELHPRWTSLSVRLLFAFLLLVFLVPSAGAQQEQRPRQVVPMDSARAALLYVSNRWEDHPVRDYAQDIERKRVTDSVYAAITEGVVDYQKISYRSPIGDMDVPAYVYQPLEKRGPGGHPAMVWVHGGVHGNWGTGLWPFVREAVERGYVIIAPEYRGSTGYGEERHRLVGGEPPPRGP
jgi:dipeptidyl aminopeptidase/acylaminoacyl peptidase